MCDKGPSLARTRAPSRSATLKSTCPNTRRNCSNPYFSTYTFTYTPTNPVFGYHLFAIPSDSITTSWERVLAVPSAPARIITQTVGSERTQLDQKQAPAAKPQSIEKSKSPQFKDGPLTLWHQEYNRLSNNTTDLITCCCSAVIVLMTAWLRWRNLKDHIIF